MKRIFPILLIIFLISCSPEKVSISPTEILSLTPTIGYCRIEENDQFKKQFMPLLQKYYDQSPKIQTSTESAFKVEIENLKTIGKEVESLIANPCTKILKAALIDAIDNSVEGFLASKSGKAKAVQESFFEQATQLIRTINLELARLADCGSTCMP